MLFSSRFPIVETIETLIAHSLLGFHASESLSAPKQPFRVFFLILDLLMRLRNRNFCKRQVHSQQLAAQPAVSDCFIYIDFLLLPSLSISRFSLCVIGTLRRG